MSLRKRLKAVEARLDELEAEPERPVWPKMPPRYDISEPLDLDEVWRGLVNDYSAGSIYDIDEFGGYL